MGHMVCSVFQVAAVHQRTVQQEAGGGDGKLPLVFITTALRLCRPPARPLSLSLDPRSPSSTEPDVRRLAVLPARCLQRGFFFPSRLLLNLLLNWTWFSRRCESALPVSPSPHGRLSFLLSARLFRLIRTRKS